MVLSTRQPALLLPPPPAPLGTTTRGASPEQLKAAVYEKTVAEFLRKQQGFFTLMTDDQSFIKLFRSVLVGRLGFAADNAFLTLPNTENLLRIIKERDAGGYRTFVVIERLFRGRDMTSTVREIKESFPKSPVMVLSTGMERDRIVYLHEVGADNFIVRPVSSDTIVEKAAFTLKPQSELGQAIDIAKGFLQAGDPEKARLAAGRILEIKPGSAAGLMVLGDAEAALGNTAAAKLAFRQAAEGAGLYIEPLRKLAALSEATGDLEECLSYLEQLDSLSPLNLERKVGMGELNLQLGRDEQAQVLFEYVVDQAAREAMDIMVSMAERIASIYATKDPQRSELFLRKALAVKQEVYTVDDLRIFNQLGINLRKQGKWREAVTEYKRAMQIAPDDAGLQYNLGMAYAQGEQMADAGRCVEKALELNAGFVGTSDSVAFNMGYVLLKNGRKNKARECLETALRLNPANAAVAKVLADPAFA
ncbi:MAG: tetratricopeptide repeat protein [Desulfovibrio sp.]|jgi:tetratricopeptide (TPR) repeat protein|nr:tetratricopeptide repeat protein [Desulfovibrio sp.]